MRKYLAAGLLVLGSATLASAAELALLDNGFAIRHDHREIVGDTTRLYTGTSTDSYVDVPTAQIVSIEADYAPPEAPAAAPAVVDVNELVKNAGTKHGLDPDFIASVVHAESGANVKAVSNKGAQGLMQLMPKTAAELGVKDSFDAAANIDAGTRYLRALLDQYNGDVVKALAAYNAGAGRVAQYHGLPPFRETQAYVRRIVADYNRKKAAAKKASTRTLAKNGTSIAAR